MKRLSIRQVLVPLLLVFASVLIAVPVLAGERPEDGGPETGRAARPATLRAGASMPTYLPLMGRGLTPPFALPTPVPVVPNDGLGLAQFETTNFSGPAVCNSCHSDLQDESGADVTNSTAWRSTMMANAATDPWWLAKVRAEATRRPELQAVIEDTCSRCHMPMAHTQAAAAGGVPGIFGDGFANPANPLYKAARDGVSCTLCHQIQPDNFGQPSSFDGHFIIDTSQRAPTRQLFGPYPAPVDIWAGVMRSGSGYSPELGAHLHDSAQCATCHTLFTPTTDEAGQPDEFPEQTPYLEWQHSVYGDGQGEDSQCQDCHMPRAVGAVSLFGAVTPPREPFFQHTFLGANVTMLRMLQQHVGDLKLTASTDDFEAAIDRTLAYLAEQTAGVTLESLTAQEGMLEAVVKVQNRTGHKFPTGYPGRRAWLHVTVTDAQGRLVFESGRSLDYGAVTGNDADLDPATYEPHYDVVARPQDVQIYESIMADREGSVTYTLLDANRYAKDNRLPPLGFDKATADEDIAVIGNAATDPNFNSGSDTVTYRAVVDGFTAPFKVRAELLYEAAPHAAVQDVSDIGAPETRQFLAWYAQVDKTPALVDVAEATTP